jgi:hypothetical protein
MSTEQQAQHDFAVSTLKAFRDMARAAKAASRPIDAIRLLDDAIDFLLVNSPDAREMKRTIAEEA